MCIFNHNLHVSIFTGSPMRHMLTHAPTGEPRGSHSGSFSMHTSGEDDTTSVGGEVPHETGTLNEYIYFFQLSVPLVYINVKFTYN